MLRNMDLIRLLLLEVEGEEEVDLDPYTQEQIGYHRWLLVNAGLAEGEGITGSGDRHPQAIIKWLNWDGHDFLDAARSDTVWNEAQQTIKEKVGTVAFDMLKALLVTIAKEQLGKF
jgi:hypothetical protein